MSEPVADIPIGRVGRTDISLSPRLANRHGLIAGATGTGKTVTLQTIVEGLSQAGVPVFVADIKGDLSGLAARGEPKPKLMERCRAIGYNPTFQENPTVFWDLLGEQGHPLRATVSDLGPLLFARLLGLTEVQAGVLAIVFRVADDNGWLLLDLKDLRAVLQYVAENARDLAVQYGNVTTASVGAIQRGLLQLEDQGGDRFFGEPALDLEHLLMTDADGRGIVNVLAADKLVNRPTLYATFLLWLLAELFEQMPEVGDLDRPKLCFFFDEAHLLFSDAPKALVDEVERVVRLIRSKGVGVYFITQNPLDVPDTVLAQLGNRVQHALRAFTPRDQKAVRAAAETFRPNRKIDTAEAITELAVGEALISVLDERGVPTPVERAFVLPPGSRIGPLTQNERAQVLAGSPFAGEYDAPIDRQSAYEVLAGAAETPPEEGGWFGTLGSVLGIPTTTPAPTAPPVPSSGRRGGGAGWETPAPQERAPNPWRSGGGTAAPRAPQAPRRTVQPRAPEGLGATLAKTVVRTVGSEVGRQIVRGVLGAMLRRR
ncbi:MAG: helicase HerA-like domain-containing protein [Alphaproteobacteria bacterium]|nr:helicase HerA-like domain-containing protein [Alphaproteobacteria bacterium]